MWITCRLIDVGSDAKADCYHDTSQLPNDMLTSSIKADVTLQ